MGPDLDVIVDDDWDRALRPPRGVVVAVAGALASIAIVLFPLLRPPLLRGTSCVATTW